MEEGLIKVEAFVEVVELALLVLGIALALPSISVAIKVCPLFLVGEDLGSKGQKKGGLVQSVEGWGPQ